MDRLDKLFVANEVRKAKLYTSVRPLRKKRELALSGKRN